eukprot:symbB.v1.2.033725.t1/scaffold4228.1/size42811/2
MKIWRGLLALLCLASVAAQEEEEWANPACWINFEVSLEKDGVISQTDGCSVPMDDSTLAVDIIKCLNVAVFYSLFIFCVKALCQSTL